MTEYFHRQLKRRPNGSTNFSKSRKLKISKRCVIQAGLLVKPNMNWKGMPSLPKYKLTCSGAMAIDKTRNLAGLLMACHLNILRVREDITYRKFYGDKESYWLGHALTSTPYHFVPGYSGGIGRITHQKEDDREIEDKEEICTLQLLHVLESTKEPFWFNNGIVEFKGANDDKYIVPTGWVGHEGRWRGGGKRFPN